MVEEDLEAVSKESIVVEIHMKSRADEGPDSLFG